MDLTTHTDQVGRSEGRVVYLRDVDPTQLLDDVSLAPLAPLGRGSPRERTLAFAQALEIIHKDGGARTEDLIKSAGALATITLDPRTMKAIIEEVGMTMSLEGMTEFYRELGFLDIWMGWGREEGREAGHAEVLAELMHERFGPDPAIPDLARALAKWPRGAVHAVTSSATLDDLARTQPPR